MLNLLSPASFCSFVIIGTMIVLNLVIGVIMNSMEETKMEREASEEKARAKSENRSHKDILLGELEDLNRKIHQIQLQIKNLPND